MDIVFYTFLCIVLDLVFGFSFWFQFNTILDPVSSSEDAHGYEKSELNEIINFLCRLNLSTDEQETML